MSVNGSTIDLAAETPPSEGEQGTAVDRYDRIFARYDDGKIFIPDDVTVRKVDKMLEVDGKARAIEQALTLPLRAAEHSFAPVAGDTGECDFVEEILTTPANAGGMSTPFDMVLAQAITACLYRRAFFEKVWRYREDGRLVYDKIAYRPPASCELRYDQQAGSFEGFRQYVGDQHPQADDLGKVWIRPEKAFVYVYGQHRKPITGISDLDTVYALFEAKQKIRFLWGVFLENLTMPKAIAKTDSTDDAEIQRFAKKASTLKGGGVLGVGSNQSLEPFETSNSAGDTFAQAIRFLDSEMSGSVLAGFTDLSSAASSGRGSLALSQDQSDFFLQSRQALLRELATAVVSFLIADPVRWNFGRNAKVPTFKFEPLLHEHAEKAVELLTALASTDKPPVPKEFMDLLTIKVAEYLNIDATIVAKAIKTQQEQMPPTPLGQLQGGADAAMKLLRSLPQAA